MKKRNSILKQVMVKSNGKKQGITIKKQSNYEFKTGLVA